MIGSQKSVSLFILTAGVIVGAWWWLGAGVAMPRSPLDQGEKLYCVSYAPFHGTQSPLDPTTHIPPSQIDEDLAQLARIADCVRTYSVDFGLDRVPEIGAQTWIKSLARCLALKPHRKKLVADGNRNRARKAITPTSSPP